MNEGIDNKTLLDNYKTLLLKRDALHKEEQIYQFAYFKTFGELLEERYSLQIECIKCKKIIAYCLSKRNRGSCIFSGELNAYIERELTPYYENLKVLSVIRKAEQEKIPQLEYLKIKRLYRKLAMMLHPDMHPSLANNLEILELWEKIKHAYRCNDYVALQETEVLAAALIEKYLKTEQSVDVEDLEGKVTLLRTEIDKIVHEEPYIYKYLLDDDEAVEERKIEIGEEIEEYRNYLEELLEEVNSFSIEEDA